uniref:Protein AF-9 homolog n=1 Tax=Panagrellus redivivus TaxID=6233 RepID=A0A7E4VAZ9_PANRE
MSSTKDRVEGVFRKSVVYGNRASPLQEKLPNDHTHRWTVYLRPFNEEPLSNFIKKVQFKLHPDYENSTRNVEEEPFEVTETGWGEFTVTMKIYFHDSAERQASCSHYLALRAPEIFKEGDVPVIMKENYDELVFVNPTRRMHELLMNTRHVMPHNAERWYFDYPRLIIENQRRMADLAEQSDKEVSELTESIKLIASKCAAIREKLKEADNSKAAPKALKSD